MLKAQIEQEIKKLASDQEAEVHPPDEEFSPDAAIDTKRSEILPDLLGDLGSATGGAGAQRFPKQSVEEKVVDELLISVPRAQGYYLKLYKEIGPNELELKQRIDQYEFWSDLEWEITKLVREHTKKAPRKWGSGKYKIIVWNDKGMRGQKRPPVELYIDAQEAESEINQAPPQPTVEEKLSEFTKMTQAIAAINPVSSPIEQQKIIAETFKAGQEAAGGKSGGEMNAMAMMMTAMVTMMGKMMEVSKPATDPLMGQIIGALITKSLGGNGDSGGGGTKDLLKTIAELKALGLFPDPKEQGLAAELEKMVALKEVAEAFGTGGGGDEGALTAIIKSLGPKVPEMIQNVTGTINKVVDLNKQRLQVPATRPAQPVIGKDGKPIKSIEDKKKEQEEKMKIFIKMFTDKLYLYVTNKKFETFPEVSQKLGLFTKGQPIIVDAIKAGTLGKDELIAFVKQYDPEHYQYDNESNLLTEYVEAYISFLRDEEKKNPAYVVLCNKCGAEYNYDSKKDYDEDRDKHCDIEGCTGTLVPESELDNTELPEQHIIDNAGIESPVEAPATLVADAAQPS